MKSASAAAGVRESFFCLDVGRETFFFQLLRKRCTKQKSIKSLLPWGDCKRCPAAFINEWEKFTLITLPLNQSLCYVGAASGGLYPSVSFGGS